MGNSLAFPSILVEDIISKTPEDHPVILDALAPQEPLIGDTLTFEDFSDAKVLEYQLQVISARPELARVKARMYVRAKNPFEPATISVLPPEKIDDVNIVMNKYRVVAETTK